MLQPKRTKFRKMHKGRIKGLAKGGSDLNFGTYGLKALAARACHRASDRSCTSCHDASHETSGPRLDPDLPGYSRDLRSRPKSVWVKVKAPLTSGHAKVKPGRVMFEIDGVNDDIAREALRLAAMKLPIKTRVVVREDW